MVLLQPPAVCNSPIGSTVDPDQLIPCDLMDGRDAFLTMAREKHWEFSSLRRAKASTQAMLYELHNQGANFIYSCNSCGRSMETRYHCRECDVSREGGREGGRKKGGREGGREGGRREGREGEGREGGREGCEL